MGQKKGVLITIEGTEGAGKSTLIGALAELLKKRDIPVTVTREPGGTALAEQIRGVILNNEMNAWTELFLYEAARCEHLARTLRPALVRGHVVICDRFTDSTLAYQAHARGLPWDTVKKLNRVATQGILPSLTVWLDINPKAGLKRARDKNRFEAEGLLFQKKVRQGFLKAMNESPKRWLRLKINPSHPTSPQQLASAVVKRMRAKGIL